jgi:hypothetical protein
LKIVSNASNSPAVGVSLTGTGLQPLNVGLALVNNAGLALDNPTYNPGDPIIVQLTLQNPGLQLITSKGFKDKPFELYLIFYDPDEKTITSQLLQDTPLQDPGPARVFVLPSGELASNLDPVEKVEGGWVVSLNIPNARDYYRLLKGGNYSVKAMIPLRTYPDIDYTDNNAVPPVDYSWIDHRNSEGALESNIVNFTLIAAPTVPNRIVISPSSSTITAGGSQSYKATGYDQNNNSLGDVTADTSFSIEGVGPCSGNSCTATTTGLYTVTGTNGTLSSTASLGVFGTTTITITAPNVVYGNNGIVTVTVNSSAGTPVGNVALSVDGGSAVSQPLSSSGSTTFTVSKPNAGDHVLNSTYAAQGYLYGSSGTSKLRVGKAGQTITFPALPIKLYGDPDFDPGATANSGLPVSYASSNTAVATIVSGKIHILSVGTSTITASQGGNANYNAATPVSQTLTVGVGYVYTGFFSPVDNPPTVNAAKAGQAIPVKWRLTDANGIGISDPGSFVSLTSANASCKEWTGTQDPIPEDASGASGLQYLGNGNWQFNWKTPKTYAGTCRIMILNLKDGTQHKAEFKFK